MFVTLLVLNYYLPMGIWFLILEIGIGMGEYFILLFILRDKFVLETIRLFGINLKNYIGEVNMNLNAEVICDFKVSTLRKKSLASSTRYGKNILLIYVINIS